MFTKNINSICVYCASSSKSPKEYLDLAYNIGKQIALEGKTLIYGGGSFGMMGELAKGALENKGKVIGVMPKFMDKVEWSHKGLSELILVDSMHDRKQKMYDISDAIISLPGGSGTFDELFESVCFKRLGLFSGPILVINYKDFYSPLKKLFQNCVDNNFLTPEHSDYCKITDSWDNVFHQLVDIGFTDTEKSISTAHIK